MADRFPYDHVLLQLTGPYLPRGQDSFLFQVSHTVSNACLITNVEVLM